MVLYHFCAAQAVKSILRHGLTCGALALPTRVGYELYKAGSGSPPTPTPRIRAGPRGT